MLKIKELTDESLAEMIEAEDVRRPKSTPKILTSDYVKRLNRGISYRIQERELAHAVSEELAAKAKFR